MSDADSQLLWDKLLVQQWRLGGRLLYIITDWERETGLDFVEYHANLKRVPPLGFNWQANVRVFVDNMLPLISNRLWNQPTERDEALINKLQSSSYTTHKKPSAQVDRDRKRLAVSTKNAQQKINMSMSKFIDRNRDTDGSPVVKGSRRHTR